MHILITITSCGTLINQALSKTAFAVTLLKLTKNWAHQGYQWILWFCIVSMNAYMIAKVITQWGKVCGKKNYDVEWRLNFCLEPKFRDSFKEGGNGKLFKIQEKPVASAKTSDSIQHHHGLRARCVPLGIDMELGYAQGREDWALHHYESRKSIVATT